MKHNDMSWRGVLASEMGVIVLEPVAYKRPELRRETVVVPGKSGNLTIKQEDAYECVVYAPALAILPRANKQSVYDWLRGHGKVSFGSIPGVEYDAVLTGEMDCTELIPGHPAWYETMIPTFECQPWQYPLIPDPDIVCTTDADYEQERWNPGNAAAAPLISVDATPESILTIRIGDRGCTINVPASEAESVTVILDCDAEVAYTSEGISLGTAMTGDFPKVEPGYWTIQCDAENGTVNSTTIQLRWRNV